jgi:hypothetical protein
MVHMGDWEGMAIFASMFLMKRASKNMYPSTIL